MTQELETAAGLAVAGLLGLAVGIEREWSGHATGPDARFAGVRTFFLLGLLGGSAGLMLRSQLPGPAMVLLAGGAALVIAAYVLAARREGPATIDGTTEAAALLVLALAALAGLGRLRLAAGVAAVVVLALREKRTIQGWVHRIGEMELRAAFQFAVLALVLLPALPEGPYGPLGGVRPRELWIVVLMVSGLNFLGYLAQRLAGTTRGSTIAGVLGGLVSSTAVTLAFSRASRDSDAPARPLALGVVGACTTLIPRVIVLSLVLQPALAPQVARYLALPFTIGATLLLVSLVRRRDDHNQPRPPTGSPLRLGTALLLAVGFQLTLMVMVVVRRRFGEPGVLASAALLGLTDMDALTFSMSRLAVHADLGALAALAMAIGVLANTLLKIGVALALGSPPFRRFVVIGLGAMAAGSAVGIALGVRP